MTKTLLRLGSSCLIVLSCAVTSTAAVAANSTAKPASKVPTSSNAIAEAQTAIDRGKFQEAIAKLKSLSGHDSSSKARIAALLVIASSKLGDNTQFEQYAPQVRDIAAKGQLSDPLLLEAQGLVQMHAGMVEDARANLEQALASYQASNLIEHQIPVVIDLAQVAQQQKLIGVADDHYEKAAQLIRQKYGDSNKLLADVLHLQALCIQNVDGRKADYDRLESESNRIKTALSPKITATTTAAASAPGNATPEWKRLMAEGDANFGAGRYQEAQGSYLAAASEAEKHDDARHTSLLTSLKKLASAYQMQQNWAEAIKVLNREKTLLEADSHVAPADLAPVLTQLGTMYQAMKDPQAIALMNKAVQLKEQAGITGAALEQDIMLLGVAQMNFKSFSDAEGTFNRLIQMAQSRGDREAEMRAVSLLGAVYFQEGKTNEGMAQMKRAAALRGN